MTDTKNTFRPLHWFHTNERSTVTVGYLVIAMTLYVTVAGVFNTGVLVNQKMKAQAVADAAAHGAATRMGAGLNEMAMLNMLAMRSRAALTVYHAQIATSVVGGVAVVVLMAMYIVRIVASWGLDGGAWTNLALTIKDLSALIAWISTYSKADLGALNDVFNQVSDRQSVLAASLTNDINGQIKVLEDYLEVNGVRRTNVYVSHPDSSFYPAAGTPSTSYLFTRAGYLTRLCMLVTRVAFADAQWLTIKNVYSYDDPQDSWKFPVLRSHSFHKNFMNSIMKNVMQVSMYVTTIASTFINAIPQWGYTLRSQSFLSEWSGNNPNDRRMMQVIALAERTESKKNFMAKSFFKGINPGDSVMAVAQAEAGNPYDEILHNMVGDIPLLSSMITFPWRLWSTMGINYQGRLTRVDPAHLNDALNNNVKMKAAWEANTGGPLNPARRKDVFFH